ncbi:MAG TPA: DEAD/DEAH box helicase, partial [Methanotrichaceae archaeon]|nr:DEAD/DEAH box helicase [Methanotrichaceae archaeon]
ARKAYRRYVTSFQRFKNPTIGGWVELKLDEGTLISKGPYIELNRRFLPGDSFESLVEEGLIHPDAPKCFTSKPGERESPVVDLHRHQSEAVRKIASGKNTIVATGTGGGKSFCFGIPVISECLRLKDEGKKGVKAIIIYPMNALANTQYGDFATRLAGSGLKLALYTGDTPSSRDEALKQYQMLTGRDKPLDCELLSREEIQEPPPDVLITNYVMLEYLLTRFHDRRAIFPEGGGALRFLVLDEVHTYTGKQGAYVTYLIRRLKQHTGTAGELRCIGTSATVQSSEGEDAAEAISLFATKLFGEPFASVAVITETYAEPSRRGEDGKGILPEKVLVTEEQLTNFDGSLEETIALVEELSGRKLSEDQASRIGMGKLLGELLVVQFLEDQLLRNSNSMSLDDLVKAYQETVRPDSTKEASLIELKAALLAGMNTEIEDWGRTQARLIPKIHAFFSQGGGIKSCISPKAPHLNDVGEVVCPDCTKENKTRITFPLVFCRACGQEYYSVLIESDGTLRPRDVDDLDVEGEPAYIVVGKYDPEVTPPPDQWQTPTGAIRKDRREFVELEVAEYCPDCKKIYRIGSAERCLCNYYNQPIHEILDCNLVLPTLARLDRAEMVPLVDEERYDQLLGSCDSNFERDVLDAIRRRALPLPACAQKTIFDGDKLIAKADFYYEDESIVIFVDGPDHDKDYVEEGDKKKRDQLDGLGYRVFVIRYNEALGERIKELGKLFGY